MLFGQLSGFGERLENAGGGLGVNQCQQLHFFPGFKGGFDCLRLDDAAPLGIQLDNLRTAALGDVYHPVGKEPVVRDDGNVARFQKVAKAGFHTR